MTSSRFLVLLFFGWAGLSAQNHTIVTPSPKHNRFFHQDTAGFIWIGTMEGWYRTDGMVFQHYGVAEDNDERYDRYVQSDLFTDREGDRWYSGYNGLHCIDGETGAVSSYRLSPPNDSIKGYLAFHLDTAHRELWLRIDEHVYTFNLKTKQFKDTGINGQSYAFAVRDDNDGHPELIIGCRWFAGPGFFIHARPSPELPWTRDTILFQNALREHIVTKAVFLRPDFLLLGTSGGLATFDLATEELTMLSLRYNVPLPSGDINDILLDWTKKRIYVTEKSKDIWSFPLNDSGEIGWKAGQRNKNISAPTALNRDASGRAWVSSDINGVHLLDSAASIFIQHFQPEALVDLKIGPDKRPYGLSATGNVYALDEVSATPFELGSGNERDFLSLSYSWKEWIGLRRVGVQRRPVNGSRIGSLQPLPIMDVVELIVHESGKVIAAGTAGIFELAPDGNSGTTYLNWEQNTDGFAIDFLHYQGNGALVMAYNSSELWFCDWRPDSIRLKRKVHLGFDIISYASSQHPQTTWAGTSEGLFRLVGEQVERVVLDKRLPLQPNVRTIIPVGDTVLLLGTEKGLLQYNLRSETTLHFSKSDGLPAENFRSGAGGLDRNGQCWMLAGGQAFSFMPDDLAHPTVVLPKPYLDQVWVNDLIEEEGPAAMRYAGFELPHFKNDLRFAVRNICFDAPERTSVALRLIGRDTAWRDLEQGTPLAYSNLAPGDYLLEIQSRNKNGIYSKPQTHRLSISRPWYELWYVQLLIVLGFTAFGYSINRIITHNRILRLKRKHEKQEAISNERMRIARRLHDDLGADLTSLMSVISTHHFLEEKNGTKLPLDLDELQGLVRDASANMREIVWAIDDQKCTFYHLVEQLTQLVNARARGGWKPVLEFPAVTPSYLFSAEQKLNVYLILKEGLQNIDKHAHGATVVGLKLRITETIPPYLEFQLTDNGPGIGASVELDSGEISGFGLDNMRHRATTINAKISFAETMPHGTCLTLLLPTKELGLDDYT